MSCYISDSGALSSALLLKSRVCFLPVFKLEDACCFLQLYAESTFMHLTQPTICSVHDTFKILNRIERFDWLSCLIAYRYLTT